MDLDSPPILIPFNYLGNIQLSVRLFVTSTMVVGVSLTLRRECRVLGVMPLSFSSPSSQAAVFLLESAVNILVGRQGNLFELSEYRGVTLVRIVAFGLE